MAVVKVLAMAFVLVVASFVATSFGTRAGNHFQSSLGGVKAASSAYLLVIKAMSSCNASLEAVQVARQWLGLALD